jgi:AraC-like DNA-binding protein
LPKHHIPLQHPHCTRDAGKHLHMTAGQKYSGDWRRQAPAHQVRRWRRDDAVRLARWRLQLAARLLETTRSTVLQVAAEVGYESEAAFSRAFSREFGLPPARYRRRRAARQRASRLADFAGRSA